MQKTLSTTELRVNYENTFKYLNSDSENKNKSLIINLLQNGQVKERVGAMTYLSANCEPSMKIDGLPIIDLIIWLCEEFDKRVKCHAIRLLNTWVHKSYASMVWNDSRIIFAYLNAKRGLDEENQEVRLNCMKLLCSLAKNWPTKCLYKEHHTTNTCLADDAFVSVCSMVQDSEPVNREQAVILVSSLASLTRESNLLLTLEKTVLSERKVKQMFQKSNDAIDDITLKTVGCSGSLMYGLEDDFHEVRKATLQTISVIANHNRKFAISCQDIVIEMLSDDIQQVRLEAIKTLRKIGSHVALGPEQISIITGAMCEGTGRLRRQIHGLLSLAKVSSAPCVLNIVDALLRNLKRYPQDKHSIWECAASIGRRNCQFVELCLTSLLRLHPFLAAATSLDERSDSAYLTVSIMVCNARISLPAIQSHFKKPLHITKLFLTELVPWLMVDATTEDEMREDRFCFDRECGALSPPATKISKKMPNADAFERENNSLNSCIYKNAAFVRKILRPGNKRAEITPDTFVVLNNLVNNNSVFKPFVHNEYSKNLLNAYSRLIFNNLRIILEVYRATLMPTAKANFNQVLNLALRNEHLIFNYNAEESDLVSNIRIALQEEKTPLNTILDNLISLLPTDSTLCEKIIARLDEPRVELIQPQKDCNQSSKNQRSIQITPIIASLAIKVKAVIRGMTLEQIQKNLCIIIRRIDIDQVVYWHPPIKDFYKMDENSAIDKTAVIGLNTLIEVSGSRCSQPITFKITLGYRTCTSVILSLYPEWRILRATCKSAATAV